MSPLDDTAAKLARQAEEQAEYERELDAYIEAMKHNGGPELTRSEMHVLLFNERRAAAEVAAREREAKALDILRNTKVRPAPNEPRWREWHQWTRTDFIRAVAWDKAAGGRGGKKAVADRCYVTSSSSLYRRWQAVAPGEPWPAGNKGPREP